MPPIPERLRKGLALLADADQKLHGWTCDSSTECCRFSLTGREPWVTQVEWELVLGALKRAGRRLPTIPDDAEGRCPFLDTAGRCQVYADRPLGCRTFFCERAHGDGPMPRHALRSLAQELDALTVTDRSRDTKARPLRSWLLEELRTPRARRRETPRGFK